MKKGDLVQTPLGAIAVVLGFGKLPSVLVRYQDGPLKNREARFEKKALKRWNPEDRCER